MYKPPPKLYRVANYTPGPDRRKHRFRCMICSKIITGGEIVIEKHRRKASRAAHADCFADDLGRDIPGSYARGMLARAVERGEIKPGELV